MGQQIFRRKYQNEMIEDDKIIKWELFIYLIKKKVEWNEFDVLEYLHIFDIDNIFESNEFPLSSRICTYFYILYPFHI